MPIEYDVRNPKEVKPTLFRFKDVSQSKSNFDCVEVIDKIAIDIRVSEAMTAIRIGNFDDARNLIKALQKALEMYDPKPLTRG